MFARIASTVRASEKCSIQPVGSRLRAFQRATNESHTLPLSPPKGGSETLLRCFTNKTTILSIKLCYAVEVGYRTLNWSHVFMITVYLCMKLCPNHLY